MASKRGRKRERQKQRQAMQAAPQTPPRRPPNSVASSTPEPSRLRLSLKTLWAWLKLPKWVWVALVVLATVITLLEGYPWLSVEEGARLDERNPYSTLFSVTNEGYIPATDFDSDCSLSFTDNERSNFNTTVVNHHFAQRLNHAGKATLPCFRSVLLGQYASFTRVGDLTETVTYSLYPFSFKFLRKRQVFRFSAVSGQDGKMHWIFVN